MSTTEDLRTPPEWAEHFGITGLVETEWQEHATTGYDVQARRSKIHELPHWEHPVTSSQFRALLFDEFKPVYPPGTPSNKRRLSMARSKKMPKFAPTAEAIRDALADHRGWVGTSSITELLAMPLGYSRHHLPSTSKALTVLKEMVKEGVVVCSDDVASTGLRDAKARSDGSKKWMLTETYESMCADRDLHNELLVTRNDILSDFRVKHDVWSASYQHKAVGTHLLYEEGEYQLEYDKSTVTMNWDDFTKIMNLIQGDEIKDLEAGL